jgi:hypothetical protein
VSHFDHVWCTQGDLCPFLVKRRRLYRICKKITRTGLLYSSDALFLWDMISKYKSMILERVIFADEVMEEIRVIHLKLHPFQYIQHLPLSHRRVLAICLYLESECIMH